MTNEDKELLFKDLCARLPYEVKCNVRNIVVTLEAITENGKAFADGSYFDVYDMKPYLRPMSSMTEEVDDEYQECGNKDIAESYIHLIPNNRTDFLNAHHFDYRRLIPKDFALKAPEGMYII